MTHICVGNLTIIGPDNGLLPDRRQAIIWTNAGILLIGPWGTNFSEILIGIQTFSFEKMHLKMSSAKWRPFCIGLNVLTTFKERTNWIAVFKSVSLKMEMLCQCFASICFASMHCTYVGLWVASLWCCIQFWETATVKYAMCVSVCFIPRLWHTNDDVIKWKHFPRNWPFVRGIHRSPVLKVTLCNVL